MDSSLGRYGQEDRCSLSLQLLVYGYSFTLERLLVSFFLPSPMLQKLCSKQVSLRGLKLSFPIQLPPIGQGLYRRKDRLRILAPNWLHPPAHSYNRDPTMAVASYHHPWHPLVKQECHSKRSNPLSLPPAPMQWSRDSAQGEGQAIRTKSLITLLKMMDFIKREHGEVHT